MASPALTAAVAEYMAVAKEIIADLFEAKGEGTGHTFHGNRYTGGIGGSGKLPFNIKGDQYFSALSPKGQAGVIKASEKFGVTPEQITREIEGRLRNPDGTPNTALLTEGAKWYPMAHDLTGKIAASTEGMLRPLNQDVIAAAIAELSPQTPWETNSEVAARLSQWVAAGKADGLTGDQAALAFKADWQANAWGGMTKGSGYTEPAKLAMMNNLVSEAADVLTGKVSIEDALTSPKQRSFANNIMLPGETQDVTVDVMMQKSISFASDPPPMPKNNEMAQEAGLPEDRTMQKFFGSGGPTVAAAGAGYVTVAAATRIVAKDLGYPTDAVQAAYWIAVQNLTPPNWPRSTGATMTQMKTPLVEQLLGHPFIGTAGYVAKAAPNEPLTQVSDIWPLPVDYGTMGPTEIEAMDSDEYELAVAAEESETEQDAKGEGHGHGFRGNRYTGGIPGEGRLAFPKGADLRLQVQLTVEGFDQIANHVIETGPFTVQPHIIGNAGSSYDSAGDLKDAVVTKLVADTGLSYERANQMIKTWAKSATDSQPDSIAIQHAASVKFGVEPGEFLREQMAFMNGGYRSVLEAGLPPPRTDLDSAGRLVGWVPDANSNALSALNRAIGMSNQLDPETSFVVPKEYFVPEQRVQNLGSPPVTGLPFPGFGVSIYTQSAGWEQKPQDDESVRFTHNNLNLSETAIGVSGPDSWPLVSSIPWAERVSDATKVVDAIYANTQATLAANDISEVTVFRGMKWDSDISGSISQMPEQLKLMPPAGSGHTKDVEVQLNPLSSFSVNTETAREFGTGSHSVMLGARVPADRIFSFSSTGPGSLSEGEVIVIGGPTKMTGGRDAFIPEGHTDSGPAINYKQSQFSPYPTYQFAQPGY
jgi:Dinitrogenase reductase ADP-ribosyltransferase (DRAT)